MRAGPKRAPVGVALPPLTATEPGARVLEFFRTHLHHTAGALAGRPLELATWQKAEIIQPLFGTLRPDGRRQYRTCFVTLPRRNGKSTLGAGIALYLLAADGEPGAQVVSAAANREQARVVFDVAARMVETSPGLRAICQVYRSEIVIPGTGSRYKVVSRDAPVQHGQNLHGLVVDELHAHRDAELYRALTSSTGSREQPMTFIITTASADRHSIATEVYRYSQQVLAGTVDDPSWLAVIYEAPAHADPWAEATWLGCNPALGSKFRALDELRTAARQAQVVPAREPAFRQLYLNQWGIVGATRWLPVPAWDACAGPPAALEGRRRAVLGLDLASTTDLTALAIWLPEDDGVRAALRLEFWMPEETLAARARTAHVPFAEWVEAGWMHTTPGNSVDYRVIEARIHELMATLEVEAVAIDPWNARDLATRLQADGVPVVEVPQTMAHLSAASKALESLVLNGHLRHDGSPVMRWCVANCLAVTDANGNLKPDKKRSHEKIDGVSAAVTGLARLLVSQGASVYDTRGVYTY